MDAGGVYRQLQSESRSACNRTEQSRARRVKLTRQLETEQALLIPKSRAALSRYGHQLVIGNELHTRKHQVVFVERFTSSPSGPSSSTGVAKGGPPQKGRGDSRLRGAQTPPVTEKDMDGDQMFKPVEEYTEKWIKLADFPQAERSSASGEVEIEELIIDELLERHERWMAAGQDQAEQRGDGEHTT